MRNLKKILALVLALVMSLSLMATTSAADFTDAGSINDTYKVAVDVLEGLGVFKGYNENGSYSFKPQGDITRAETAAIIYRIVTGDVDDKQIGLYADYNIFEDVSSSAWYAGYVNFCANAQYIKGVDAKHFNPTAKVEGYAALAMILRAIGYTANGGFTGSDWRVQTARVGEAREITKNISATTLRSDATREIVAEKVDYIITVNFPAAKTFDKNTNHGFPGFYTPEVTNGTQLITKQWGAQYVDTVKFGFVGVDVGGQIEPLIVGKVSPELDTDYTTYGTLRMAHNEEAPDGPSYRVRFDFTFTIT